MPVGRSIRMEFCSHSSDLQLECQSFLASATGGSGTDDERIQAKTACQTVSAEVQSLEFNRWVETTRPSANDVARDMSVVYIKYGFLRTA